MTQQIVNDSDYIVMKPARTAVLRMARMHAALMRKEKVNCSVVARALEVSPKSIQRDIDFMRDQLQLPLQYDQRRQTFYYTESVVANAAADLIVRIEKMSVHCDPS